VRSGKRVPLAPGGGRVAEARVSCLPGKGKDTGTAVTSEGPSKFELSTRTRGPGYGEGGKGRWTGKEGHPKGSTVVIATSGKERGENYWGGRGGGNDNMP